MRHHESSGQPNEQSQLAGPTTVLSAVGFSSSGVVAGTTAAAMQSSVRDSTTIQMYCTTYDKILHTAYHIWRA